LTDKLGLTVGEDEFDTISGWISEEELAPSGCRDNFFRELDSGCAQGLNVISAVAGLKCNMVERKVRPSSSLVLRHLLTEVKDVVSFCVEPVAKRGEGWSWADREAYVLHIEGANLFHELSVETEVVVSDSVYWHVAFGSVVPAELTSPARPNSI
jgi:hypothetical protein